MVAAGEISAEALVRAHFEQIDRVIRKINAS